mmetsp:Transcript_19243/g.49672  ORF Transcript_19243/g.49672 Transcript_19243/m.49672 type:complete len:81 (+) Transcript_19243:160-402(+)
MPCPPPSPDASDVTDVMRKSLDGGSFIADGRKPPAEPANLGLRESISSSGGGAEGEGNDGWLLGDAYLFALGADWCLQTF